MRLKTACKKPFHYTVSQNGAFLRHGVVKTVCAAQYDNT